MSEIIKPGVDPKDADFTAIDTHVVGILAVSNPWKPATLTPSQIKGLLKVGVVREAEMHDIQQQLVTDHPNVVPSSVDLTIFLARPKQINNLQQLEAKLESILADVITMRQLLQNNQFVDSLNVLNNARTIGANDATIAKVVKDISDAYFDSNGVKLGGKDMDIQPSSSINIAKVTTGKVFTNTGKTILLVENASANASVGDSFKVNPFAGEKIPKGWTKVKITNLSATDAGSFNIYHK